ncbi:MAG TPA: cupin domain-containing protein [Thermoanaerobaculia bacterium]|nr:cupin domain-containing protein [Thermoanaerobaculia bacterium]
MSRVSQFVFDLGKCPPQVVAKGGTIQEANQGNFTSLAGNGLAIYLLTLEPGAVRIPHWHPDAAELDYVLSGKARVGLGFPDGEWERFDLAAGQIAILPQGWFHYIENVGEETLRMLVIFNNSSPNDIGISQGFQAIPKEVLGLTFGVPAERFEGLDLDVTYIAPQ